MEFGSTSGGWVLLVPEMPQVGGFGSSADGESEYCALSAVRALARGAGIQLQAFWRQHSGLVTALGGGLTVLALDQVLLTLLYPFIAHPLALSTHITTLGISAGSVLGTVSGAPPGSPRDQPR